MVYFRITESRKILIQQLNELNQSFELLASMNFIKFTEIFQNMFYLLGFKKKEINIPMTNLLDWRQARGCKYFLFANFDRKIYLSKFLNFIISLNQRR